MKIHTTEFKNNIKLQGRELDRKITFNNTVLGSNELNAVIPSFKSDILKSVMKQLDIDSNVLIPIGTTLNFEFGVKVNDEYEYINYGNYVVKEIEKQEDTNSYKITCYDKMLFSMRDYGKLPITYPISIRDYINSLCLALGITFKNRNEMFANYDKIIKNELYLDANGKSLGYTFRDIFDELAQVTASTICINENDELEIRYINETNDTIDEEFLKDVNVNFGEKYGPINSIVLSRSAESDNIYLKDDENILENGLTEIKIVDNQIMNFNDRDSYLPDIFGKLSGLEYYLNDYSSTGITYYDICDRYNVKIGDNNYSCIMFNNEINNTQGLEEFVYTEIPQQTETDYTKADKTDRKINQTYLIVDKQNQQIEAVISQTDEQNQKIAQVTQTVEELNSKISDIADITTSAEDTDAKIELNEINQSEPIRLIVRPIGESISNLIISSNMLISDNMELKQRTIRFTNIDTNEVFDYSLPDDLWYYDSENYDEFILDYDGQSCVINKKVGLNEDGTFYLLETPTTVEYEFPAGDKAIVLTDGNYKVEILGYDTGYIFARLMAKNIYTTQFYTKAETDSIINQTSQSIDLSVNKKLSNYSTTTQMNSAIQLSASSITSNVSETYATKNELNTNISNIEQTANSISLEVAKKVNNDDYTSAQILMKINDDTSSTVIKSDKLDIDAIATFTNNKLAKAGTTTINGANITTGTIAAERLDGKVITTDNFSAQKISANNITSGTVNASSLVLKTSQGYLEVGTNTQHPKVSGLNVGSSGININGLGLNNNGSHIEVASGVQTYEIYATGRVRTNYINANASINLLAGGSSGTASNGGILLRTGNGHITLDASNGGGYVYAEGVGVSNSKVLTNNGAASSKNTKQNIKKFDDEKYDKALKLLKGIDLYNYDYKYDLYRKRNQYGFIIDEIEQLDNYDEFFDFTKEKAKVDGEHLDFAISENDKNLIEIKQYDSNVLDKYLLTCLKAMQNKIESLENKIKEMESEK